MRFTIGAPTRRLLVPANRQMSLAPLAGVRQAATAQFIAEHSLSYRLANGDPDQRGVVAGKPIGSIDDETLRCRASSLTPQAGEVRPAAQACKTAHQEVRRPLNRKTMTPLFSAAGENLTSLFGAHPF